MENKTVINIEMVIDYIEHHLDGKLDLETIALDSHYSKYPSLGFSTIFF